jgi:cell division protein FtsI/penicillin-binding protein 2
MHPLKRTDSIRLFSVLLIFALFYFATLVRLFYWQVIKGDILHDAGKLQSTNSLVTTATRGDILFSDNFPIATNKLSYLLFANPKKVDSSDNYAKLLSPILELDEASISAKLSQNLYWVRLLSSLDFDTREKINALKLNALGFEQETTRYYPEASLAAHLVGFVGKNQDGEDQGYFGLEGYYDRQLKGRPGRVYMVKDALGNPILTDIREDKKIDGRTIVTSVDRSVQYAADKELKKGLDLYDADGGSVVIMESATGKILAASSFPKFDPQKFYEYPGKTYTSPIVSDLYEPGSTFKVLVMAAGIDAGLVTSETRCTECSGPVTISDYTIKTWDDKYFPNSTMTDVIMHSDNTGMVFVGNKLGVDGMLKYMEGFGIGDLTGIDIQGEGTGSIRSKKFWHPIDLATASFGQGISVTPLQLITGVNAIANGGKLMKPMVVDKIIAEDGRVIKIAPEEKLQVITDKTSKIITEMMVNAVENGEAKFAKIKDYKIAGKTGTAQIPVAGHYDPTNTNASFVGFFPAENPKITMLVIVNRPRSSIYGAETAAPIFFSIARDLIQYYNIPPSP